MLFYSRCGGKIFRRSCEWPATHLTPGMLPEVDTEAISAIRGQRGTNLESNPSLFKLSVSFSKLTESLDVRLGLGSWC